MLAKQDADLSVHHPEMLARYKRDRELLPHALLEAAIQIQRGQLSREEWASSLADPMDILQAIVKDYWGPLDGLDRAACRTVLDIYSGLCEGVGLDSEETLEVVLHEAVRTNCHALELLSHQADLRPRLPRGSYYTCLFRSVDTRVFRWWHENDLPLLRPDQAAKSLVRAVLSADDTLLYTLEEYYDLRQLARHRDYLQGILHSLGWCDRQGARTRLRELVDRGWLALEDVPCLSRSRGGDTDDRSEVSTTGPLQRRLRARLAKASDRSSTHAILEDLFRSEDGDIGLNGYSREDALRAALWVAVEDYPEALEWLDDQPGVRDLLREDELQLHLFRMADPDALRWWSSQARSDLPRLTGYRELLDALVSVDQEYANWYHRPVDLDHDYRDRLLDELDSLRPGRYRRAIEAAVWTGCLTEEYACSALQDTSVYERSHIDILLSVWYLSWPNLPWHQLNADRPGPSPAYAIALGAQEVSPRLVRRLLGYAGRRQQPQVYGSLVEYYQAWQCYLEDLVTQPDPHLLLQTLLETEGLSDAAHLIGAVLLAGLDYWEVDEYQTHLTRLWAEYPEPVRGALLEEVLYRRLLEQAIHDGGRSIIRLLVGVRCPGLSGWLSPAYEGGVSRCPRELRGLPPPDPDCRGEVCVRTDRALAHLELPLLDGGDEDPQSVRVLLRAISRHWPSVEEMLSVCHRDSRACRLLRAIGRSPPLTSGLLRCLIAGPGLTAPVAAVETLLHLADLQLLQVDWKGALLGDPPVGSDSLVFHPGSLVSWLWQERQLLGFGPELLLRLLIEYRVEPTGISDDLSVEERDVLQARFGDLVAVHPSRVANLCRAFPDCTLVDCLESAFFMHSCRSDNWEALIPVQDQWVYPGLVVYHQPHGRQQSIDRVLFVGVDDIPGAQRVSADVQTFGGRSLSSRQKRRCQLLAEQECRRRRTRVKGARASSLESVGAE